MAGNKGRVEHAEGHLAHVEGHLTRRGLQSAMAGLGGTGPPVTVRLEVIGDYSRDELAAAEAAAQAHPEPCQHRQSAVEGSLPARGSQGALRAACAAHDASRGWMEGRS